MEFSVPERVSLISTLPREGGIETLRILRDLQTALGFSEEELEKLNLRQEDGRVLWDGKGAEEVGLKEIQVGRAAKRLISKTLEKMDKEEKLPLSFIDLYERFVKEDKEEE